MTDCRLETANAILKKCFWGEYNLSAQKILDRLDENDQAFMKFLFSKIIENSDYPSRHIKNIFSPVVIKSLLKEYPEQIKNNKRIRLIRANLTGDYDKAPEYKWQR